MNVASPAISPIADFARPSIAFPRYTLRDLLIEVFYHKWLMLIAFVIPVALGLYAGSVSKPAYVAQAKLLVLYGSEYFYRPVTGQSTSSSIPLDRNEIMSGELQVIQSQTLALDTLKAVGLDRVYPGTDQNDPAALRQAGIRFEKDFSATAIAQSNVLDLSFRSYNPNVAANVLKALISGYLDRRSAVFARPPSTNMQADQNTFQERLRSAEEAITKFSNAHGIGNFDAQMSLLLTMQSSNQAAQDEVTQAIGDTTARLAAVQQQSPKVPSMIQLFTDSDRSQRLTLLTAGLAKLQIKRRELTTRYQPGAPAIEDVDRNIASIQSQMGQTSGRENGVVHDGRNPVAQDLQTQTLQLQAQLQGLKAKQAETRAAAVTIAARVREFNDVAQESRDLQRNRDVLDQTYRSLVRTNEDAQIADAAEHSRDANIRLVQPPEPPAVGRNLATILVIAGIAVGIGTAIASLAVTMALKQVFVSARDVNVMLELPVLVSIPRGTRTAPPNRTGPAVQKRWGRQTASRPVGV